jgi:hypothetical protein
LRAGSVRQFIKIAKLKSKKRNWLQIEAKNEKIVIASFYVIGLAMIVWGIVRIYQNIVTINWNHKAVSPVFINGWFILFLGCGLLAGLLWRAFGLKKDQ